MSGSVSWRESRTYKLAHQFKDRSGGGGNEHLSDLRSAGSENFGKNGPKENEGWEPSVREKGWQDIRGLLGKTRKRSSESVGSGGVEKKRKVHSDTTTSKLKKPALAEIAVDNESPLAADTSANQDKKESSQIFRGLTMYLNGSTMPLVSDHKLKQLWVQHGGGASITLARRKVTHVILAERGAGGGLASGKIQKENTRFRGEGVKYVTAQWVLDSIERGVRQPEFRYTQVELGNKLGGAGQKSVASLFRISSQMEQDRNESRGT